ncbi:MULTISPECIES: ABC transporter permease [Pseudoxanthomonas]|uniref:ABC transporter permease n=1 Tax=Pseudoxanthomonas japonensis TaxID=69284 RepID=A0ABQ6ZEC6_9GAMM|nr:MULTISPECIES: ABC transporter permease [Pseudoxanthomonas]KAF1723733.1 ABC transporter permease [Pseudoxanthomonas japonensis]MCR6627466.1 ABC transporter permease [Pseudoxanthomonas sp.]NCT71193.1 ABC transporter permease [Xanthomonadaceae bacterium]PZQ20327.1 MAG: ABC transporter permease [Stenotrophomonas acidaminiphila]
MNAVTSTLGKSSKPGAFTWLLKREFWENRGGFFWAPVITGGIFLVLNLILAVIGSISARGQLNGDGFSIEEAPEKAHQIVGGIGDGMLLGGVILACVVLAFVVFFYALGTLYDDRRDRSVLFWKSLPVSDTHMVLSKLAWALVLAPLLAVGVGIVIGVAMWLIFALTVSVNGLPVGSAVFTHSHPLRIIGGVIASLPVYMLWALPTIGWLMFCSAWARSKPFLWAVLVPVLACVIISMTDILPSLAVRHDLIWYTVVYRGLLSILPGAWFPTLPGGATNPHADFNTPDDLANAIDLTRSWEAFATADLWIGAVIGVALIAGAIYLRRWRESE